MIPRYTRHEMGGIWEPENRFQKWLDVEIAACEAWARIGKIPRRSLSVIKKKAAFDITRIDRIEKTVKHDVIAFLTSVAEKVGPDSRFIHMGLTSSDVVDTAQAVLMRDAIDIILRDIEALQSVIRGNAMKYNMTIQMGRSHGIHAEPMTFGLKFALWYEEMKRNTRRLQAARETISCGTLSGPVGTYSSLPPAIEKYVCMKLGLKPAPVATQVIQRDRHAEYMSALALTAATVEKIALEIRHLQKTDILEVEEPFEAGQKGSSAMPHKRNPVGSENLCGLARVVRSNAFAAVENIALWHERDISHSSVERIIIPDSTILVDYMLARLTGILRDLQVYPDRMKENINRSFGLHCSQRVLLSLVEKGISRENAYKLVQRCAMKSWKGRKSFQDLLKKDAQITRHLSEKEIDRIFDVSYYLRYVDFIFRRVFGRRRKKARKQQ